MGISFPAVVVVGLGKNILFKSVLGHCDCVMGIKMFFLFILCFRFKEQEKKIRILQYNHFAISSFEKKINNCCLVSLISEILDKHCIKQRIVHIQYLGFTILRLNICWVIKSGVCFDIKPELLYDICSLWLFKIMNLPALDFKDTSSFNLTFKF